MAITQIAVEAVIFDAGNTLVFLDHEVVAAAAGITEIEHIREGDRRVKPVVSEKFARGAITDYAREYYGGMLREAGVTDEAIDAALARLKAAERIFPLWRRVNPEARPAVAELRSAGMRTCVVSNSDGRVEMLLAACALNDLFEFILDSHLEGVEKPDPEFFLRAARRLKIDPSRCAYVGDIPSVDVVGARAAGMLPILYDPLDAWRGWSDCMRVRNLAEIPQALAR